MSKRAWIPRNRYAEAREFVRRSEVRVFPVPMEPEIVKETDPTTFPKPMTMTAGEMIASDHEELEAAASGMLAAVKLLDESMPICPLCGGNMIPRDEMGPLLALAEAKVGGKLQPGMTHTEACPYLESWRRLSHLLEGHNLPTKRNKAIMLRVADE